MIRVLSEQLKDFIEYLDNNYPLKGEVKLIPLWGWDAVQSDESGDMGFAVYIPPQKTIMCPMEVPENVLKTNDKELIDTFVIHNLAHEYKHALQFEESDEYCEQWEVEADEFADKVIEYFMKGGD